jgi:hypothetical protein
MNRRGSQTKMTERLQTVEAKMRRHDKQQFANTRKSKISLQSTMRERLRKMAIGWSSYNSKLMRRV